MEQPKKKEMSPAMRTQKMLEIAKEMHRNPAFRKMIEDDQAKKKQNPSNEE